MTIRTVSLGGTLPACTSIAKPAAAWFSGEPTEVSGYPAIASGIGGSAPLPLLWK